jgi:Calx-beta domain
VVTPTQTGNESDLPVTADYGGDGNFEPSTGGGDAPDSVIPAVVLSAAPVTVDTYLDQSGSAAKFNLKLSRAASTPVTVSYETQDGSGDDGLKASDGDYKPAKGTLTFPATTTDETVQVQVYADITVRVDSGFDLLLSSLQGAAFPTIDASASLRALERPADTTAPSDIQVAGNVVPDLIAGKITQVKLVQASISHQQQNLPDPIGLQAYKSTRQWELHNLISITRINRTVHVGDRLRGVYERKALRECEFVLKGLVQVTPGSGIEVKSQTYDKTVNGTTYKEIRHEIRFPELYRNGEHGWIQLDMSDGILTATS